MQADDVRRFWLKKLARSFEADSSATLERSYRAEPPSGSGEVGALPRQPRCETLDLIGAGGMGEVYKARQAELEREVALKKLRAERQDSAQARSSFLAEAVVTGRLEHPNIVPVYALGTDADDEVCLAMKLVEGDNWRILMRETRPDDRVFHIETLIQVCNAVAYAHSRGIIHNDLKPENVMVGPFGEVMVLDWGLAVSLAESDPMSRVRSRFTIRHPVGTPAYMAPELARGDGPGLGTWTDVYLLGAILCEILTGRPPHAAKTLSAAVERAVAGTPPVLAPTLPAELRATCLRALRAEPEERHPSVQELQEELRAYLRHRESHELARAARARLAACSGRPTELSEEERDRLYGDFAEVVAGFVQARVLWEESPEAGAGERDARLAFAQTALALGDLGLARAQLARLGADPAGAELARRLAASEAARDRERAQRRRLQRGLTGALAVLFCALAAGVLGLLAINRAIEEKNAAILTEKQAADRQRGYADRRGAVAASTLERLTSEVHQRLMVDLGYTRAEEVSRDILEVARQGWEDLRETDARAGRATREGAFATQQIGELALIVDADLATARRCFEAAAAQLAGLHAAAPDDLGPYLEYVQARLRLAEVLRLLAEDEALTALAGRLVAELRAREHPAPLFALQKSRALRRLGQAWLAQGEVDRAGPVIDEALAIARGLAASGPAETAGSEALHAALAARAAVARAEGEPAAACGWLEESLERAAQELAADPGDARLARLRARTHLARAEVRADAGQSEEAEADFLRGLALLRAQLADDPTNAGLRRALCAAIERCAALWERELRDAGAADILAEAVALRAELVRVDPHSAAARQALADVYARLAEVHGRLGHREDRRAFLDAARLANAASLELAPDLPAARRARFDNLAARAALAETAADVEALSREAAQAGAELAAERPDDRALALDVARSERRLAEFLAGRDEVEAAAALLAAGEARVDAVFAAGLDPSLLAPLHRYGALQRRQGDLEAALRTYRALYARAGELRGPGLRDRARWCDLVVELASLLAQREDFSLREPFDEAVREARALLAREAPPQRLLALYSALSYRSLARAAAGQLAEARADLAEASGWAEQLEEAALAGFPSGHFPFQLTLLSVEVERRAGDLDRARATCEEALLSGHGDGAVLFAWAQLEALADRPSVARELLRASLAEADGPAPLVKRLWLVGLGASPEELAGLPAETAIEAALLDLYLDRSTLPALLEGSALRPEDERPLWTQLLHAFAGLRADFAGEREAAREAYARSLDAGAGVWGMRGWCRDRLGVWGE